MYYLPNLRKARKKKGLTQKEVCQKLEMKQSQYSRYESGEDEMKVGTLIQICNALEVSADYILGLTKDPTPNWTDKKVLPPMKNNTIENILNNNSGSIGDVNINQS